MTPEVEAESWLVLADSYYPGWKAFIRPQGSGEDAEEQIDIHLVNGNFRGVRVPPGAWIVRFRYSPPSFQIGAFGSFLSGMLILFTLMLWLWRRFYREDAEGDSARRIAKNSLAPIILNLFNRGIDFAFAFIMLRILGPADAGIYYYAIVIFGWFDILTNFGLNTFLTREVARNRAAAGRYLLNSTVLRLGLALAGVPLLIAFLASRQARSIATGNTGHRGHRPPVRPVAQQHQHRADGAVLRVREGRIPRRDHDCEHHRQSDDRAGDAAARLGRGRLGAGGRGN